MGTKAEDKDKGKDKTLTTFAHMPGGMWTYRWGREEAEDNDEDGDRVAADGSVSTPIVSAEKTIPPVEALTH